MASYPGLLNRLLQYWGLSCFDNDASFALCLSFAAGAMIFVVVEELIPESQNGHETDYSTVGAMLGFTTMMLLDVALA